LDITIVILVFILTLLGLITAGCGIFSNFIANKIYKIQSSYFSVVSESIVFTLGCVSSGILIIIFFSLLWPSYGTPAHFMVLLTPVLQSLINLGILIWNGKKKENKVGSKLRLLLLASGAPLSLLGVVLLGIR